MDFKRIKELKKDGFVKINRKVVKTEQGDVVTVETETRAFDPATGKELDPVVQRVSEPQLLEQLKGFENQKARMEVAIENIKELLAEFKK